MGIYDRDYERGYDDGYGGSGGWRPEGSAGGLQLRWPTTVVGWVLVVTFGVYLVELLFNSTQMTAEGPVSVNRFVDFFELRTDWITMPWYAYGLFTYGWLHDPRSIFHIAFNMFSFWMFGRELERKFGSREFLFFYLAAMLVGGLAFTLGQAIEGAPAAAVGASAGTVAVVILFALLYPNLEVRMMGILPMPMWVLGVIMVAGDLQGSFFSSERVAFTAHLGGAAFAFLYQRQQWRLSRWLPESIALPSFKRGPKLRVHHGDEEEDVYDAKAAAKEEAFEAEFNRVLDKVRDKGQDSLTRREKKVLQQASRRAQQRRQ
ncbi:MAG: rhomboid family intramembrane serine protease [Planctomycetota bacterium]